MSSERLEDRDLIEIITIEAEVYVNKKAEKLAISGHEFPPEDVIEKWRTYRKAENWEFAQAAIAEITEITSMEIRKKQ